MKLKKRIEFDVKSLFKPESEDKNSLSAILVMRKKNQDYFCF